MRYFLMITLLLMLGCESSQVRQERLAIIQSADDVTLCYSIIDERTELDHSAVLRELKHRKVDSCLALISEHECPEVMESRQSCIDETKVRVAGKLTATRSGGGTELFIKGLRFGMGVLPF